MNIDKDLLVQLNKILECYDFHDKEFLKQIDEQQKEIDLLEKALEEEEDFLNWIEQE